LARSFITRDTVIRETPARRATSSIVAPRARSGRLTFSSP
jgi:hypothetical protein